MMTPRLNRAACSGQPPSRTLVNSLSGPISVPVEGSGSHRCNPRTERRSFTGTPFPDADPPPRSTHAPMRRVADIAPRSPSKTKFNGVDPGATSTAAVNVTPLIVMFRTPRTEVPARHRRASPRLRRVRRLRRLRPPIETPIRPGRQRHRVATLRRRKRRCEHPASHEDPRPTQTLGARERAATRERSAADPQTRASAGPSEAEHGRGVSSPEGRRDLTRGHGYAAGPTGGLAAPAQDAYAWERCVGQVRHRPAPCLC